MATRSRISPASREREAVLQAGFLARPAAVHQLYRPTMVCLDGAVRQMRRNGARLAGGRRIRCRAALRRAGGFDPPRAEAAVPARHAADRQCGARSCGAGGGGQAARHFGRGRGRCGARYMAGSAHAAGHRAWCRSSSRPARRAVISRPASRRCASARHIATSRSSASTTSRTITSPGRSGCSRTPIMSCRCRMRSIGRTSTTAASRRRRASTCCS